MIKNIIIAILLILLIWVGLWYISPLQINQLGKNTIETTNKIIDVNKKILLDDWKEVSISELLSTNWDILGEYWKDNIKMLLLNDNIDKDTKEKIINELID